MSLDANDALKLMAVCVALSAYLSNVRRDLAKRCSELKRSMAKTQAPRDSEASALYQQDAEDLSKNERKIRRLLWGDIPLVLASLAIALHWGIGHAHSLSRFFLAAAEILFGFAVVALAFLHFLEWRLFRRSPH